MKVTKQIDKNTFEVKLENIDSGDCGFHPNTIQIAHDYVRFYGYGGLYTEGSLMVERGSGFSNFLSFYTQMSFDTREFMKVVLPYLNEMYKDITLTYDGQPTYTYYRNLIYYKNKEGVDMVAVKMEGETDFSHVTAKFFDKLVKPTLVENYHKYKEELKKKENEETI